MFMTHDPVMSVPGLSSKENNQRGNSCTRIFITELFAVAKEGAKSLSEQRAS